MIRLFGILTILALGVVLTSGPGSAQAQATGSQTEGYVAGIWIDPDGCDHWIIDDGVEGYMSPRLDKYGKPVCSGVAPPNTATGDFKKGCGLADIL